MKVDYVGGCPYEDNSGEVLNLTVILDEGEVIRLGDTIDILMMDDTYLQREVMLINPRYAGDYAAVSKKMRSEVDAGETCESKKKTTIVTGPCRCTLVVMNVPYHEVKTDDEIAARELQAEQDRMMDLTPYREFTGGRNSDSITEHALLCFLKSHDTTSVFLLLYGSYEKKKNVQIIWHPDLCCAQ